MIEIAGPEIPEFRRSCESGTCVEVGTGAVVSVRDSKNPGGPVLTFTRKEWIEFVRGVKAGMFDIE